MLSTPASIETHPASPRSRSISSLHKSILVCIPNLMRRAAMVSSTSRYAKKISSMK
jgi:hypothetical protein